MANQTKAHIKLNGTNVEFPNKIILGANPSWGKRLIIGGDANSSTANDGSIGVTNGNLHIDAATSSATYLNFYDGTGGVAFGSGAGAAVAWMGPDGDLWKGSSDNNGSKYWHAGNDGAGSGLDADTVDTLHASSFLRSDTSDQMDGTLTIQSGGANTYGRIRGYPNDNHFITIRGKVTTGTSTLTITGAHQTTFVEHANESNEGWYFVSKASGNYTEMARIDGVGQMYIGGNKVWHAGSDGAGSGLDADTVDGQQGATLMRANARKIFNVAANGAQARRHTVGRLYYCGRHWGSDWQNIRIRLIEDSYSGGYVDYHIFGYYNGSDNQTLNLKVVDFRGLSSDTQRYKIGLGTHTDAGWDHSGQNVYYSDLYVDVAYYKNVRVIVETDGHTYQTSNPTSGGWATVLYDSISATNISDFTDAKTTSYIGNDSVIWNSGNDGANSGLDADLLDGQQGSYYLNTSGTGQTKSGDLTADQFISTNNGSGTNYRVGDDAWIGDINVANTFRVSGVQNANNGYITFGNSSNDALGRAGTGALTWAGSTIWHAGNDGPGSGLNADLLDGIGGDGYLRSNASDDFGSNSANQTITFKVNSGQYIASGGSESRFPIQIYAPTANGGDAAITFHISGDYAGYFGLASDWNDLAWGGWSVGGSTKYRILHTGNYSSWNRDDRYYTESEIDTKLGGKLGETTGAFGLSKKVDFYIYGDDDKYYPVIIDGGSAATNKRYQIYRGYSETAPSTWNTSTHKGSLTFDYEIRVGGWGGYTNMYSVNYFGEQYSRQCAKLAYANHTMQHVVWLRGGGSGGAIYHIESTANISVTPHYDTSASNYVSGTGWRTYDNSNDAYDTYYNYLDVGSSADAQTQSTIIDHMFIKANGQINEASGGGSFSSRFALLTGATFTGNVSTPRLALGGASFSSGEDLRVGGIRGRFTDELIHMYAKVNIGYPSGWGGQSAPAYGLSTYGGAELATNTGNVAIGHTSPASKLHVKGAAGDNQALTIVENTHSGGGVYYPAFKALNTHSNHSYGIVGEFITQAGAGTDRPAILFSNAHSAHNWQVGQGVYGANDNFAIGYRNFHPDTGNGWSTARLVIDTSGRVGIGQTSPGSPLHVSGDIETSAGSIRISDNWGQGFYSAEQLSIIGSYPSLTFRNNSQDHKWLVHHDGGSKLQFYEGADWDSNSWTKRMTFQNGTSGIDAYRFRDIENTDYYVEPASTSNLSGLTVVNTITGRINGLADRGFGDTELSFYQDSGGLGSQWSSGWASHIICNHGNGSNYYNQIIHMPFWGPPQYSRMQGNTSSIAGRYDFCTNEASFTTTHTIQAGTLRATADVVAYYSSDKRLKDNIIPIGNAIDKIKQIGGYEFDWNDKQENFEGHDYGVIAQEVEKVLPELVKDREDGYKGVRYEKLTSVLIQGIKEQQDTIENQQKQIDELKDLVNQLINK